MYYAEDKKWPEDEEELRIFAQENDLEFDWSRYSDIQFIPQDDGNLIIEAEFAPPNSGSETLTLTIKDEELRTSYSNGRPNGCR